MQDAGDARLMQDCNIGRFFRLLSAFNVVEETAEDCFKPTPFSYAIGDESTKVRASLQAA